VNASNERGSERRLPSVPANPDKQGREDLWQRHKAERGIWSEKMLMALARGVKGGKWFSLIDKVASERTLSLAWEKVRSNAGACGVDGITIARFEKDSENRLLAVREHLLQGSYQPKPVKRVRIPKPGSAETRPLGIPTVTDRVVQQAVRLLLEPIFEHRFAEHSYGFRPERGCHDALRRVNGQLVEGHGYVVDIDIQGYFDAINQTRLMKLVEEEVADGELLEVIARFLKAGVLEDGEWQSSETGTPQGGVLTPRTQKVTSAFAGISDSSGIVRRDQNREPEKGIDMSHIVFFMRQSGQSIGYGTNPACEYGDGAFTEESDFRRSGIVSDRPVQRIFASGASLPSTGSKSRSASFFPGIERGLHSEVVARLDPRDSFHRPAEEPAHQRSGDRGFTDFHTGKDPWLSPTLNVACVSSLPAVTIATLRRSWRKFTGCWFPAWATLTT
jgi:retron-type reverse transcriptase